MISKIPQDLVREIVLLTLFAAASCFSNFLFNQLFPDCNKNLG